MSSEQGDLDFQKPAASDKPVATKKVPRKRTAKKAAKKAARKTTRKQATRKKAQPSKESAAADSPPIVALIPPKPKAVDPEVPHSYSSDADVEPDPKPKAKPESGKPADTTDKRDNRENRDRTDNRENRERPDKRDNRNRPDKRDKRDNRERPDNRDRDSREAPSPDKGSQAQGDRRESRGDRKGYRAKPFKQNQHQNQQQKKGKRPPKQRRQREPEKRQRQRREGPAVRAEWGELPSLKVFRSVDDLNSFATGLADLDKKPIQLEEIWQRPLLELREWALTEYSLEGQGVTARQSLVEAILDAASTARQPIFCKGIVDLLEDGNGLVLYESDNYQIRPASAFLPRALIRKFGIKKGTIIEAQLHPRRKPLAEEAINQLKVVGRDEGEIDALPEKVEEDLAIEALTALFVETDYVQDIEAEEETCPYVVKINSLMGKEPEVNLDVTPFEDLIPYYPLERFILETDPEVKWDNTAMRVVDLLTPVGLGQRGLIVAPPRTGKTVLQQAIANAVAVNRPDVHLIVLLIDERPEEVTDFRRQITSGEIIASTFDETPENHVQCVEMVIEKARRMVENEEHVIILLDSITRLARAYNALASNSGKILSGGVESNALQKPKRFFGSARNIEGGGSLTILGTALIETGSRMDEVIFEEFKGTGNMELHLDRALSDKRIFPAIEMAKSGTRKEELLYHPEEMQKVYGLRRAMKGVPPTDAMEMLITRIKKTSTNIQFLMGVNT